MKFKYKLVDAATFSADLVPDDYVLQENETFTAPISGAFQPYSFKDGLIVGSTKEEYIAWAPKEAPAKPSEQQTINQTMLARIMAQQTTITELTKRLTALENK